MTSNSVSRHRRRQTGPIHPQDKFLFARDTEEEANTEARAHRRILLVHGLEGEWGVYVRPTVVEVERGKGRNPGRKQRVFGVYVGRHENDD